MLTNDRSIRIYLTTEEFSRLIKEEFVLDIAFSPSGAWLEWKVGTPVPNFLRRLGELRGVDTEGVNGEGI